VVAPSPRREEGPFWVFDAHNDLVQPAAISGRRAKKWPRQAGMCHQVPEDRQARRRGALLVGGPMEGGGRPPPRLSPQFEDWMQLIDSSAELKVPRHN
jgi:hypothetical protein